MLHPYDAARRRKNDKRRCRRTYRFPLLEEFEPRLLLDGSWQNPYVTRDVSGDGVVVPLDALMVINEVNRPSISGPNGELPPRSEHPDAPYLSVNGDNLLAPVDAVLVINALNGDRVAPSIAPQLTNDTAPRNTKN